jgi:glutathionylspermidine synthase
MYAAAEAVAALHEEVAQACLADPELLRRYFSLTPFQDLMWRSSAPAWHGLARADVFLTENGPVVCELNCDTPSGEAEAVLLNAAAAQLGLRGLVDPNVELESRFCELVEAVHAPLDGAPRTVGIIYPTEIVEDLSMIVLYQRWLEARGWKVVLGSPFNLHRVGDRAALFGEPCGVFVRHYKTDWWGEREPIWRDEPPFPDATPLEGPLSILLEASAAGRCTVVNPFGSVLTQNKRSMALMWEEHDRFPAWAQSAMERYLPYTARLESMRPEELADRAEWVLKADYGCEGAEVIIGARTSEAEWAESLAQAIPHRWIAQRCFRDVTDAEGRSTNHGVYLVGGAASGYFTRVHAGATGYDALSVPTFIEGTP